jgi:hypothetical protein
MSTGRHKDGNWDLPTTSTGALESWDHVNRALLMDLRDELKLSNELTRRMLAVLECHNTAAIPRTLARIDRRLAKRVPLK